MAHYIDSGDLTMEEAVSFVRRSHVLANASAHILREKDGVLQGLSTRPKAGTTDDFEVSYANISLFHNDYMMAKRRKAFRRAAWRLRAAAGLLRHIFIAMSIARMIFRIIRCQICRLAAKSIESSIDFAMR